MLPGADNDEDRPRVILGLSKIELDHNKTVGVQVNRVIRNVLWKDSPFGVQIPADRAPQSASKVVPYAEGNRVREMMNWSGVKVLPLTPARAKKSWSEGLHSYGYYASNGQGRFPFLISPSKVTDPPFSETVYRPGNGGNETADLLCPETHGFNMIAEQAYLHRQEIYLAVACMDLPAKAEAARYLAESGVNIYAPCDRFAYTLMGYKARPGINGTILGSAPIRQTERGAVIGDQPVALYLEEPIVIGDCRRENTMDRYCDAPRRYFGMLNKTYDLHLNLTNVNASAGEAGKVVEKADALNAHVIGIRVCCEDDKKPVKQWLRKDPRNRAVLLHSAAYEPGCELFKEFPNQTTFGDLSPVIERGNALDRLLNRMKGPEA